MKKDRLIALTDAVLAIIMTILILELENQRHQVFKLFGIYGKISLLIFFPFLVGIVMDGTKYIVGKG